LISAESDDKRQTSGLWVASKFPVLKQAFKLFGNGVGTDALGGKGVLFVELDLGSLYPRKVMKLFVVHFQVGIA